MKNLREKSGTEACLAGRIVEPDEMGWTIVRMKVERLLKRAEVATK